MSTSTTEKILPPTPLLERSTSAPHSSSYNPLPQNAPGASAAVGHTVENSIPLSIFPISLDKLCICFCGLPGRGKTHIAHRLARYLSFFHAVPVEIFAAADYRRREYGNLQDAEWFDPTNKEAQEIRSKCNSAALKDAMEFLQNNKNGVAILDSTNPTHDRRVSIKNHMLGIQVKIMFIEVNNEDESFLKQHYNQISLSSPDYTGRRNSIDCEQDFRKRVDYYRMAFESIDEGPYSKVEKNWTYFKCDHSKQHFVLHNVFGYLPLKVVHFIINLRVTTHAFYLTRHGQSEYNSVGRIGGDSGLSPHGVAYAQKLAEFVEQKIVKDENGNEVPARLWTSTMRRTKETSEFITHNKIILKNEYGEEYEWVQMRPRAWHHLDELFAGEFDGMTYEEIEQRYPEEFTRRNVDKLAYRYPRGESYLDVIARLEPIIIEMERHREPLLVIGHQAVLRIIYGFYMGLSRAETPYVSIPLNCVIELIPTFNCQENRYHLYTPLKPLPLDGQDETKSMYCQYCHASARYGFAIRSDMNEGVIKVVYRRIVLGWKLRD